MNEDEASPRRDLARDGGRAALTALVSSALVMVPAARGAAAAATHFDDGRAQASEGPPQLSTLLTGYAARPPWSVAGVDYAVGAPQGLELKDPASISASGVSVDAARLTVFVDGEGVVLDGYDFGRGGGWGVYINPSAKGTVIRNSRFGVGAAKLVPIHAARQSGDLSVSHCTFDGGAGADGTVWALIAYSGSGVFSAEHNIFADAPADAIDFDTGSMTTIVRYNLFEDLGSAAGSHPDTVQYVSVDASDSVIDFNTVYEPHPSGLQGIQLSAQLKSKISRTRIMNNTLIARGPGIDMSYSIAVGQTSDSEVDGVVVANNYLDVRGAYGPFYPPTGRRLSFVGNVDAASGRLIGAPDGSATTDVVAAAVIPPAAPTGPKLTVTLDRPVFVRGALAIRLRNGERVAYEGGSGSTTLVFGYGGSKPLGRGGKLTPVAVELPPGAAVADANGNPVDLSPALPFWTARR
jgi:hypothetical protein